jgi:hypothetical protein
MFLPSVKTWEFIIHYSIPIAWPSCSPYLTVSIFLLWGSVKNNVYSQRSKDIDHLKVRISRALIYHTRNVEHPWEELTSCLNFAASSTGCTLSPIYLINISQFVRAICPKYLIMKLTVFFFSWGGTTSTWYCGHFWPIVQAPDDRWGWLWSNWWNEEWQGKPKYSEKTYPSTTLSTTNLTWPDPGSNPGRRGGKLATNRLSYGPAKLTVTISQQVYLFHSQTEIILV